MGSLHPQPPDQPYLALVVPLSVARLPRHTKRVRPWSRRKTNLADTEVRTVGREWGGSILPTPGSLGSKGTAAAGAAKRGLDPHPCRKVLARLIFTPELQV